MRKKLAIVLAAALTFNSFGAFADELAIDDIAIEDSFEDAEEFAEEEVVEEEADEETPVVAEDEGVSIDEIGDDLFEVAGEEVLEAAEDYAAASGTFTVEIADGTTEDVSGLVNAIAKVKDDGKITAQSDVVIDENIVFSRTTGYILDLTEANVGNSVEFSTEKASSCLVVDGAVYTYHYAHKYGTPGAQAYSVSRNGSSDPSNWVVRPTITLKCEYDNSHEVVYNLAEDLYTSATDDAVKNAVTTDGNAADGKYTFTYTLGTLGDGTISGNQNGAKVSFEVPMDAGDVTYSLDLSTVSYVRYSSTGPAILDDNNYAKFTANYYEDDTLVKDENAEAVKLTGVVKKKAVTAENGMAPIAKNVIWGEELLADQPATTLSYGEHTYTIEFTFPDNTKQEVIYHNVVDTEKLEAEKKSVKGIQYAFTNSKGKVKWVDASDVIENDEWKHTTTRGIPLSASEDTEDSTKNYALIDDTGIVTYRIVYVSTGDEDGDGNLWGTGDVIYGDAESYTLKVEDDTTKTSCGALTYPAGNSEGKEGNYISFKFTDPDGNMETYEFDIPAITLKGEHTWSTRENWAKSIYVLRPAAHGLEGVAVVTCENNDIADIPIFGQWSQKQKIFNGQQLDTITLAFEQYMSEKEEDSSYYVLEIPKSNDHSFDTDDGNTEFPVEATCSNYGFKYKKCSVDDGNWKRVGDTTNYTYDILDEKDEVIGKITESFPEGITWHPVYVEGSSTGEYGEHMLFVRSASFNGTASYKDGSVDVTCEITTDCQICDQHPVFIAHTMTYADYIKVNGSTDLGKAIKSAGLDEGSEDTVTLTNATHIFNAINVELAGEYDCSEYAELTFTVQGWTYANGKALSETKKSSVYSGSHNYKNAVVFTDDLKKASVVQTCQDSDCLKITDVDGNKNTQSIPANVEAVDNADGSTTYTATLEGFKLTDNVKSAYDITKAVVTINGGEDIDLNEMNEFIEGLRDAKDYEELYWDQKETGDEAVYTFNYSEARKTYIKSLTVLEINGAVIDEDLYNIDGTDFKVEAGANKISLSGTNTVSLVDTIPAIGTVETVFNVVKPGILSISTRIMDGAKKNQVYDFEFDGETHTFAVTAMDAKTHSAVDADIAYAVIYTDDNKEDRYLDTGKKVGNAEFADYAYGFDAVELIDAGEYTVYAKLSADGYTSSCFLGAYINIAPADTDGAVITTKTRSWTYGDKNFVATTGNAELDETIGLVTEDISTWGVGTYPLNKLVSFNKNYDVTLEQENVASEMYYGPVRVTIVPRSATVVLSDATYDYTGEEYQPTYEIKGLANDDDLNVEINVEGNRKLVEPGTYKISATANNANYDIATTTATITIKASTTDAVAAQDVIDKINALTDSSTAAQVEAARKAYDKLTDTQKAIVSADTLKKLEDAETKVAQAASAIADAKKNAEDKATAAKTAADKAKADPTDANVKAAETAVAAANTAIANAKKAGADTKTAESTLASANTALTAAKKANEAAKNIKITFGNKKVTKKLNAKGTATKKITIKKGKKLSLKAKASDGSKITYKSNKKKVATVSKKGVIKAKKKGSATITVKAGAKTVKVKIKVK